MRVTWTSDMLAALQRMRADGTAIYWCAEEIGVDYGTAVLKCRELGIANRMNRGPRTGEQVIQETKARHTVKR